MPDGHAPFEGLTIAAARRAVSLELASAGFADASREARFLIEHATGLTPEQLLIADARPLSVEEAGVLSSALARRLAHEPLSRIKGQREFYGRTFTVTPAVLDPRPETETLVDLVLEWADANGGRGRPFNILDVGTGSGCILLTLLCELPNATGMGTDVSPPALAVARANATSLRVGDRASFFVTANLDRIDGPYDILVSNPPYIPHAEIAALDPEVRDFDPVSALDGGDDGLAVYRAIAARAGHVVPAGLVAFEVGAGQAPALGQILMESVENRAGRPWSRADLGGHDRTVALLTQR